MIVLQLSVSTDELMSGLDQYEIEQVIEWIRDNKPKLIVENASAQELLFHQQIYHIRENYSRLTIEQEEAIKQIYESL